MKEQVNSPDHYHAESGIEVIDAIESWTQDKGEGFIIGNIIKYVSRCQSKQNKLTDLKKARWYLNRLIERLEKEEGQADAGDA